MKRRIIAPIACFVIIGMYISGAALIAAHSIGFNLLGGMTSHQFIKDIDGQKVVNVEAKKPDTSQQKPADTAQKLKSSTNSNSNIVNSSIRAGLIGIFVSDAPDSPSSFNHLRDVASMGFNVVFNYSSFDGSPAQVKQYLDLAQSLNIKVIMSLKDLYDQLPNGIAIGSSYPEYGNNNTEIATNIVQQFGPHPAVWGFDITDETPETPASLPTWLPILQQRYSLIKSLTTKPVMQVQLGYSAGSASTRQSFLSSLKTSTDTFALDEYPIPFANYQIIGDFSHDLHAVVSNGWFIVQAFSWAQYPTTASNLGYNLALARVPTTEEMVSMANLALNNGVKNILFYSYFDITSANQKQAIRSAVSQLRNQ